MRALIQRVARAEVRVADTIVGSIDRGLLVLLGVREGDTPRDVEYLASKVVMLRIEGEVPSAVNPPSGCHFHTRCPRVMPVCRDVYPEWRQVDAERGVACHLHSS